MLTITESGTSRRSFLTAGALGLGGLSLASLLGRASAADSASLATGKSVIFLFQQGGPSQFESYDPKPDALESIRTVTGIIPTKTSQEYFGPVMVGSTFTVTCKIAERFERKGRDYVTFEFVTTDENGKLLMKKRDTFLQNPDVAKEDLE